VRKKLLATCVSAPILALSISISVPLYQKGKLRSKEACLERDLLTLRVSVDRYTFDKKKAPQSLQELVNEGYLRAIPIDPITGSNRTWNLSLRDPRMLRDGTDVHSGADQLSLTGTPYSQW
jgi:general secretion pathway protein G